MTFQRIPDGTGLTKKEHEFSILIFFAFSEFMDTFNYYYILKNNVKWHFSNAFIVILLALNISTIIFRALPRSMLLVSFFTFLNLRFFLMFLGGIEKDQ